MNEIDLNRVDLNLLVVFEVLMDTRNVTAAADKLGKTQSAISHSLARLREQLGDPLMVKVGGRMTPSPFAEHLIEDIRPILRSVRRAIAPQALFDPGSSERVFRIAVPTLTRLIADVSARVAREAPGVRIEWLPAHHEVYSALSEGLIDLAHLGGEPHLPDGLQEQIMEPFSWVTFARRDHPATQTWGMAAWRRFPHLMVNVTRLQRNPFSESTPGANLERRVTTMIADSAGVASILSQSDFLATFPAVLLAWDMEAFGLAALKPPIDLGPRLVRFFWSSRLAKDAGGIWMRSIVIESYRFATTARPCEGRSRPMPTGSRGSWGPSSPIFLAAATHRSAPSPANSTGEACSPGGADAGRCRPCAISWRGSGPAMTPPPPVRSDTGVHAIPAKRMGEQPSRELAPAVPTTGTGDAPVPPHAKSSKVRRRARLRLKPLQSGTQPLQQTLLQGQPSRRSRRLARPLRDIRDSVSVQAETISNWSDSTLPTAGRTLLVTTRLCPMKATKAATSRYRVISGTRLQGFQWSDRPFSGRCRHAWLT